jgi:hypothetical protein
LPIPVASPTRRRLIPSACVRRSTSRIFLIDNLSAGIGHLLVARKTDQLIRLSTGAISTPPSPAVRNHRIAVRLALESVSALNRIPHLSTTIAGYVADMFGAAVVFLFLGSVGAFGLLLVLALMPETREAPAATDFRAAGQD